MKSTSVSYGFVFRGKNTKSVLKMVRIAIDQKGKPYKSQKGGIVKSIKGITLVIENPLDEKSNYPYWDKPSDNWYQDNFVKKETNNPPETISEGSDIYPYKYVWRSRFYDNGVGYIKGVVNILTKKNIHSIELKGEQELTQLLKSAYTLYHPEIILSVLAWKGKELMDFYLKNPKILDLELTSSRRDTLLSIIDEIKQNPTSRRAITPSFTYEQIDHSGVAGGVPVYQNYQLYLEFDGKGRATGIISLHLHRAMDAMGGTQLDISHDRQWGLIASRALGLPLKKIIIYSNDFYFYIPGTGAKKELVVKTDIKNWLFAQTDSYDFKTEDIEKRLASPNYQKKIKYTLDKLNI